LQQRKIYDGNYCLESHDSYIYNFLSPGQLKIYSAGKKRASPARSPCLYKV